MSEDRRASDRKRQSRRQRRVKRTQRRCTRTMSTAMTKERQAIDARVRQAPAKSATGPTEDPATKGNSSRSQGRSSQRRGCLPERAFRAVSMGLPPGERRGHATRRARMGPSSASGPTSAVTRTHRMLSSCSTAPSGSSTVARTPSTSASPICKGFPPWICSFTCGRPVMRWSMCGMRSTSSSVHHFATCGQMGTRTFTMCHG
mmetsp:Transcript_97363/g.258636  ORF Transcript_97363/g.258636 Transcript_97363/m.258636 type:complete len:203 (-) Transcript_97363:193-801(-)